MFLPTHRRAFLPVCLTLGVLFCSLPALADTPAAPAAAPTAQTILLQHTVPSDILKALHWDQAARLPEGVTQISALPATNSLSIVATPAGLARVQQIVKIMDIAQRRVQIKFALANATAADLDASGINFDLVPYPDLGPAAFLKYMTGKDVTSFLQTLTRRGAVTQSPVITTSNNISASLTLTTPGPQEASATFAVTPRINSDDSVTLALHPVFQEGTAKREIKTLRTVKSSETMVIVMPPITSAVRGKNLLLFVTPTVLPTDKGAAVMMVK